MKLETKLKKWDLWKWKKEAWDTFSVFIRQRDGGKCVTCGAVKHWKEMQAGHYRTGATCKLPLFFDERNVHCQCVRCNINLSGNWRAYQNFMHMKYGEEIDAEFDEINKTLVKWDKMDYVRLIEKYE